MQGEVEGSPGVEPDDQETNKYRPLVDRRIPVQMPLAKRLHQRNHQQTSQQLHDVPVVRCGDRLHEEGEGEESQNLE